MSLSLGPAIPYLRSFDEAKAREFYVGFLGFNSALERDYMVTMGILAVSATLMLLGNILSDFIVAMVDPRVSYK